MIQTNQVSKTFDNITAVNEVSLTIPDGSIFGLLGTNGAGKSTLLRMIAGIYKPDAGTVTLDEKIIFENPFVKKQIFYISDNQYFFPNTTSKDIKTFYQSIYLDFRDDYFDELMNTFGLDTSRKIRTFSKGMRKQLSLLLGICASTKYLLCDETFDGLDPVMRQGMKRLFVTEMDSRGLTPIIASHNLRELEDICDHIGLLHQGGILLSKDLADIKTNIHKIQCVYKEEREIYLLHHLSMLQYEKRGSLITMTVKGEKQQILDILQKEDPVFCEILPLSLEEIFISETEVAGYDIKHLVI
ncbi:ABC transporter ATP-binding protein [Lachnospiraceae bacterium LCP25S3_G4]